MGCELAKELDLQGEQDASVGVSVSLSLSMSMSSQNAVREDLFWDKGSTLFPHTERQDGRSPSTDRALSLFECVVCSHPPILESVLAQLPTSSVLDLCHTSKHLHSFLRTYPLAWKTLSFRLPQPALMLGSPGMETPDARERQSKSHIDALLIQVVIPVATRLKSLDLCNTAISGIALVNQVLQPRLETLQHLSVRGCKNVSIKYHIVPFLRLHSPEHDAPWLKESDLMLKSLYTYRCRHHRRRPYLTAHLVRRDSDSEPTHELIEICHALGIWTDTAWCPTPGARCFRRKDYHAGRAAPGSAEVWVPFDRLWRSGNRVGPSDDSHGRGKGDGRLWESIEHGHNGEALGTEDGSSPGEGKDVPVHLRASHKTFVDNIKCDQCGDEILERCEQCSVRMHCMGCRKTLCASCSFNRPIPRKRAKTRQPSTAAFGTNFTTGVTSYNGGHQSTATASQGRQAQVRRWNRFWWAPGATRSPNLMYEGSAEDDSSDTDESAANPGNPPPPFAAVPPKLNMHWCCLEPIFSGGGGIAFLGPALGGGGADKIRAAPLPRAKGYEDPDFTSPLKWPEGLRDMKNQMLYEHVLGDDVEILPYLEQESIDLQSETCPRSLCQDCYRTFRWKVSCRACKKPLCKEHDFRALKVRKCGYRNLDVEREYVRSQPPTTELQIPAFKASVSSFSALKHDEQNGYDDPSSPPGADIPRLSKSTELPLRPLPELPPSPLSTLVPASSLQLSEHAGAMLGPHATMRHRSLSLSDTRTPSSWPNSPLAVKRLPLPCNPRHPVQWEGCGAYFCQQYRPVGDCRGRCAAQMKECADCGVYVCEFCLAENPPCTCAYCASAYHCPHCLLKPSVQAQCRREEEHRARVAAELADKQRRERDAEFTKRADEVAESIREFFGGVSG